MARPDNDLPTCEMTDPDGERRIVNVRDVQFYKDSGWKEGYKTKPPKKKPAEEDDDE